MQSSARLRKGTLGMVDCDIPGSSHCMILLGQNVFEGNCGVKGGPIFTLASKRMRDASCAVWTQDWGAEAGQSSYFSIPSPTAQTILDDAWMYGWEKLDSSMLQWTLSPWTTGTLRPPSPHHPSSPSSYTSYIWEHGHVFNWFRHHVSSPFPPGQSVF